MKALVLFRQYSSPRDVFSPSSVRVVLRTNRLGVCSMRYCCNTLWITLLQLLDPTSLHCCCPGPKLPSRVISPFASPCRRTERKVTVLAAAPCNSRSFSAPSRRGKLTRI